MGRRPLVSFVLLTHDQERWAGEAAGSALSQTHRPLGVILSDDCSSDATFEVLRRAAAGYEGPHRVVLNRNSTNLGVAAHAWRAAALASGTRVAIGHGDDISLPDRVAATTAAFTRYPDLAAVTTRTPLIDAEGAPITSFTREGSLFAEAPAADRVARVVRFMRTLCPTLLGGATPWRPDLFDRFGPSTRRSGPMTCCSRSGRSWPARSWRSTSPASAIASTGTPSPSPTVRIRPRGRGGSSTRRPA